LSHLITTA